MIWPAWHESFHCASARGFSCPPLGGAGHSGDAPGWRANGYPRRGQAGSFGFEQGLVGAKYELFEGFIAWLQ